MISYACSFKQHPHCKFNVLITYDKISNGDIPQILTSIFALDAQKKITTLEFSIDFHHPAKIKYGNKNVLSKWLWNNSIYIYIHIQSYIHEYMYIYIYTYFCMHTIFVFIFNCIFFKIDNWNHMCIYIYIDWLIAFFSRAPVIDFSQRIVTKFTFHFIYTLSPTSSTSHTSSTSLIEPIGPIGIQRLQYSYNIIYTGVMT